MDDEVEEADETNNEFLITIEYLTAGDEPVVTVEGTGGSEDPPSDADLPDLTFVDIEVSPLTADPDESGLGYRSDIVIRIGNAGGSPRPGRSA